MRRAWGGEPRPAWSAAAMENQQALRWRKVLGSPRLRRLNISGAPVKHWLNILRMALGFVDFSRGTEMHFASVHERFAKRRMRMNGLG